MKRRGEVGSGEESSHWLAVVPISGVESLAALSIVFKKHSRKLKATVSPVTWGVEGWGASLLCDSDSFKILLNSYGALKKATHRSVQLSLLADRQVVVTAEAPDGHDSHIHRLDLQNTCRSTQWDTNMSELFQSTSCILYQVQRFMSQVQAPSEALLEEAQGI